MSTTPETPTPDYGEPWRVVSLADGGIASSDGSPIVDKLGKSHRAIACVNACAGIANPAAEIEAMRAAIREAYVAFTRLRAAAPHPHPKEHPSLFRASHEADAALAKLKPFITQEA